MLKQATALRSLVGNCGNFLSRRIKKLANGLSRVSASALLFILAAATGSIEQVHAAQVQHLNTQSATATGAGATGTPTIASFNIPSGKNRVLFIWPTFERDHCSNADVTASRCVNGNTAGTGLGDNYPEPRIGTPPATTTNNQLTARVVGTGGTINKQNALVIGGTPSGDTRFVNINTSPTGSPAGTSFMTVASFHIVLFENEINTLLGGAASGTVSITLPDTSAPSNAGDDALLIASVYQNVEQTPTGFVRNFFTGLQAVGGVDPPGNYSITTVVYDAGQIANEADDGKLVMGANATTAGFITPAGHVALATLATTNAGGNYDTPSGGVTNEPNGMSGGAYFRNGGATPASIYTLTSAGTAAPAVYGGTTASFLLESDNADVGDAPISYGNPTHTIAGIRLGASVDADASLLNNATATGDDVNNTDDENGVTLMPLLPTGEITVVPVDIQNASGFLSVWFDWNADGDFLDVGEQMVTAQAVAVGPVNINIAVPLTAIIGPTFARFRVCTNNTALDNCNTPVSTVQSGEVEDYQFTVSRRLILRKITLGGVGGAFGFALTNTAQATGTVSTTVVNTPTTVDGNTGSAATLAYTITSPTTAVTINENSLPVGWSLTGATCVNNASVAVGSLTGSTYTITGAEIGASVSFTCTFTNTLPARPTAPAAPLSCPTTPTSLSVTTLVNTANETPISNETAVTYVNAGSSGNTMTVTKVSGLNSGGGTSPLINQAGTGSPVGGLWFGSDDLVPRPSGFGQTDIETYRISFSTPISGIGLRFAAINGNLDGIEHVRIVSVLNSAASDITASTTIGFQDATPVGNGSLAFYTDTNRIEPSFYASSGNGTCCNSNGELTLANAVGISVIEFQRIEPGNPTSTNLVGPERSNGITLSAIAFCPTAPQADLRLTKTNTPGINSEVDQAADTLVSGAATNYTIVVTNLGPDAANGSVITDPAPTNLTCTSASCTAAGGATCPVPTGVALVTALQGAGATIPVLPNGGAVTVILSCTVN